MNLEIEHTMLRRLPSDLQDFVYGFMDYGRSWERDDMLWDLTCKIFEDELIKVEEEIIRLIKERVRGVDWRLVIDGSKFITDFKKHRFKYIQNIDYEPGLRGIMIKVRTYIPNRINFWIPHKKVWVHLRTDIEYEGQPNWVPMRIGTLCDYMDLSEIYEELEL